jgi:hypothetical protein
MPLAIENPCCPRSWPGPHRPRASSIHRRGPSRGGPRSHGVLAGVTKSAKTTQVTAGPLSSRTPAGDRAGEARPAGRHSLRSFSRAKRTVLLGVKCATPDGRIVWPTVGIADSIRSWRERRQTRQANAAFDQIAPVLHDAEVSRWEFFQAGLTPDERDFLDVKWRLFPHWRPGEGPPQPRSVEEIAVELRLSPEQVRELDWGLVDLARTIRRQYVSLLSEFVTVPIDGAQSWWRDEWSWLYCPDGRRKPRDERGSEPARAMNSPRAIHEVDDIEALRGHLVKDHDRQYSVKRRDIDALAFDHRTAHGDEAQDAEWDRRYRGIGVPPPDLTRGAPTQ